MKAKRKINFFEVLIHIEGDKSKTNADYIRELFTGIERASIDNGSLLEEDVANGNSLQISLDKVIGNRAVAFGAKAKFIKLNELPDTLRKHDNKQRSLSEEVDSDEGILEETHFAIDTSFANPILGVETNQSGPKHSHIQRYLNYLSRILRVPIVISEFRPVVDTNIEQFLESIRYCASLEMKVATAKIPDIKNLYENLGTMLEVATSFSETDYAEIILSYNFRVKKENKPDTSSLISFVKKLFGVMKNNDSFADAFDTLQIRAQESDEPLQLYDLIADKIATEVYVERKNPRSKYFETLEFCEIIKNEIRKNFGSRAKA